MPYSSWFQCIDTECSERMSLTEIVYTCPKCEGLLMVAHDVDALKTRSGAAWMKALRRPVHDHAVPVRQRRFGARRSGSTRRSTTPTLFSTYEGGSKPFQGHPLRGDDRRPGPSGSSSPATVTPARSRDLGMTVPRFPPSSR